VNINNIIQSGNQMLTSLSFASYHGDNILSIQCLGINSTLKAQDLVDKDYNGVPDSSQNALYDSINGPRGAFNVFIQGSNEWNDTNLTNKVEPISLIGNTFNINFSYNFTNNPLDLSKINVILANNGLIINASINMTGTKTITINTNKLSKICVKDAVVSSFSEISANCIGANEYILTPCIGSSYSIGGINCVDNGSAIIINGLNHTAINFTSSTSLTVYDGADPEGGSNSYFIDSSVPFYANYSNATNGQPITGASCNISFDLVNYTAMSYSSGLYTYTLVGGFNTTGNKAYRVICSHPNFETLSTLDNINILTFFSISVPEFNTVTLLLSLVLTILIISVVRYKKVRVNK
jgi:hypothetical protein